MANIKTAKKRIKINDTKAARNKAIKSKIKTLVKKVEAAILAADKDLASKSLTEAISAYDSACTKGVYHKNTVARKVSRLTKRVRAIV